jgi:gliding motility-associated-like protein
MNLTKRIFSTVLFSCFLQITFAQLESEQVSAKLATQYSKYDTIYTFNAGVSPSAIKFIASAPDHLASTFEWSRYDTTTKVFLAPWTESSHITSAYTLPNPGGYKVRIYNGSGLDTTFTFWTFIDTLSVELDKKVDGTVNVFEYVTCDHLDFKILGIKWKNGLRYFDPLTNQGYTFSNKIVKYLWTAEPQASLPRRKVNGDWRVDNHPYEDTWYSLSVTDSLGGKATDKVKFMAVKPKAKFSVVKSNDKGSSPLKVWLTNESSNNATKFIWYTQSRFSGEDTIKLKEPTDSIRYYEPGVYKITLIAKSYLCSDSISDSLKVELPKLPIANFFTPNGDGVNDVFIMDKAISVVNFKITIFSRNGKKVFEDAGETLMNWSGWNGKINGSGSDAAPGMYYYVLEIMTYERKPTVPWAYKGFFYLIRNDQ